jgi:hypothetical protein
MYPRGVRDLTIGLAGVLRVTVTDESVCLIVVDVGFDGDRLMRSVSLTFGGGSGTGSGVSLDDGRHDDGCGNGRFRLPAAGSSAGVVIFVRVEGEAVRRMSLRFFGGGNIDFSVEMHFPRCTAGGRESFEGASCRIEDEQLAPGTCPSSERSSDSTAERSSSRTSSHGGRFEGKRSSGKSSSSDPVTDD